MAAAALSARPPYPPTRGVAALLAGVLLQQVPPEGHPPSAQAQVPSSKAGAWILKMKREAGGLDFSAWGGVPPPSSPNEKKRFADGTPIRALRPSTGR